MEVNMFNATELLINDFVNRLIEGYRHTYGGFKSDYGEIIAWVASMALENIANSDALYHNVEHTILVTLVGQEILRGKHIREGGVSCEHWLHFHIALLCHDIGYIKGVGDMKLTLPRGATDASLTPYHVDRGKMFVEERFGGHRLIDADLVKQNIELTRFPVPAGEDHQDTVNYPGLVRAADLIGQLSDPRYLQKLTGLFYEFEETGQNQVLGYDNPADLREGYPKFYWNVVYRYVKDAIGYLELTQQGKQIVANLNANVFRVEHSEAGVEEVAAVR
jgi:hypothetical protein